MSSLEEPQLPHIRTYRHFRIKSTSKEKVLLAGELLTARNHRKSTTQDQKRLFSDHKNRNSGSIDTPLKVAIAREHLAHNFQKRPSTKKMLYEAVKTDGEAEDSRPSVAHIRTFTHEGLPEHLPQFALPRRMHAVLDQLARGEQGKVKKDRTVEKQVKGKYRCRVNQYIFDHSRKKSHTIKEQEAIDEFWKNVNESMILVAQDEEEPSKDLREFVEHFQTE